MLLENCQKIFNYIEIRIKSCQRGGTNCRIYGIKIFTNTEDDEQLPSEIFLASKLQRNYPKLTNFKPTFLYRRSELILRFIKLFDLCMDSMLPSWTYGDYFQNMIKVISFEINDYPQIKNNCFPLLKSVKKLLILSSRRINLLEKILNSIPVTQCYLPLIYIDRPLAFAYRGKIALDPKYQNTIFMQIYNNLNRAYSFR